MSKQSKPPRLFYAAGPGNVLGTYQYWLKGQDDPSQVAVTYSGQFYEVCHSLHTKGYVFSSNAERALHRDKHFTIEHCPKLFTGQPGILYHLGQVLHGLRLILTALLWRADVVIVADETTHWFVLTLLPYLGINVIPSLHCVLWQKYLPQRAIDRLLLKLGRHFFAKTAYVLAASQEVAQQVEQIVGRCTNPSSQPFLPLYREDEFSTVLPPVPGKLPFRVLFAGRIEKDKGVFDLLEVAKSFAAEGRQGIEFHFCGAGTALVAMKTAVMQAGLESSVIFHGYCQKNQMREQLSQAHILVVPTKSTFVEGFNQVVAEGILSGRPVVASAVCPALAYVQSAVVEVQPDDIQGYKNAIMRLWDNPGFYQEKQQSCAEAQAQFYDMRRSWGNVLKECLQGIGWATLPQVSGDRSKPTAKDVSDLPALN
jgi:glycosyltransferase involved in cell wall biosynthesis